MEQSLNIFAPVLQVKQLDKSGTNIVQAPVQSADSLPNFDDLILDSSQTKLLWSPPPAGGIEVQPIDVLEQQILELSANIEDKLEVAVLENVEPKAVEEILSEAVTQFWELLVEFDAENGTQLSLNLSESLQQKGLEVDESFFALTIAPQIGGAATSTQQVGNAMSVAPQAHNESENTGVPITFIGQPVIQVTSSAISTMQSIVQLEPQASPKLSQSGGATVLAPSLTVEKGSPALPSSQWDIQGGKTPLLSQRTNLGNIPAPPPNGVQVRLDSVVTGNTKLAANSAALASEKNLSGITAEHVVWENLSAGQKMTRHAIIALPENIQQYLEATPVKKSASSSNAILAQTSTDGKVTSLVSPLVAGVDVGVKVKELLLASARVISSGKEASASFGENGGLYSSPRTEYSPPISAAKTEQSPPPSSFSKNIANQIQEVTLNMGRTRIELAPRGLGGIVIELQPKDTSGLQVVVRAENAAVLQALRADREVLLTVLSNNDVQQENISLNFEGFGQSGLHQGEEEAEVLDANIEQVEPEADPFLAQNRPNGHGLLDFFT